MHPVCSRKIVDEPLRLKAQGLTDKAIAAQRGVSVQAIRHWRYANRRSPDAEARRADHTMCCPRCSDGLLNHEAHAYLLGACLGDGHLTNTSTDITDVLTRALDRLSIAGKAHVNKRESRYRDAHVVSVSRGDAVARMDESVGPGY